MMAGRDVLLRDVEPGEGLEGLAKAVVEMLGLERKAGSARHEQLLLEFLRMRKKEIPLTIEEIARTLGVSVPQAYHEMRKWKTLGIVDNVRVPAGDGYLKGFMLSASTLNRAMDRVEYRVRALLRKVRRVAKELDDMLAAENFRRDGQ